MRAATIALGAVAAAAAPAVAQPAKEPKRTSYLALGGTMIDHAGADFDATRDVTVTTDNGELSVPAPRAAIGGYARVCVALRFPGVHWDVGACAAYSYARSEDQRDDGGTPMRNPVNVGLHQGTAGFHGWIPVTERLRVRAGIDLGGAALSIPDGFRPNTALGLGEPEGATMTAYVVGGSVALVLDVSDWFGLELGADASRVTFVQTHDAAIEPSIGATRLAAFLGFVGRR